MLQPSEEIKARLNIVDVIRDYIPLRAAGINFRARCPFHNEKTPSFMISPEKQIWHCFGCSKGGDIFAFIMEIEGVDFAGALRILAPKAGVVLTKQDPKLVSEKNRVLDILDLSRKYYHKVLRESSVAAKARNYLHQRGLDDNALEEWQIGYSPDSWDTTYKFLRSKGYTEKEIFAAGLSVKSSNQPGYYDRFRGRIMFPIINANGNTVAFTARVSPEKEATETMGKYINSPQTMVYDKSRILFGWNKAKTAIKKYEAVIVVEGQMDVITAHQHGWQNVVASSGTALTAEQINLIKRLTNNIYLAFDMDKAGELAADRGVREALAAEMNIKIVELPEGKDPDECIKNNLAGWEGAINGAKQMMQYYFDKALANSDLKKIEKKQRVAKTLLPIIAKLGSKVEQGYWLKELGTQLDVSETILRETISPLMKKNKDKAATADNSSTAAATAPRKTSRPEKLSDLLLSLLLKFFSLNEYAQKHVNPDFIVEEENRSLYKNLLFYYNNVINDEINSLPSYSAEPILDYNLLRDWLAANSGAAVTADGLIIPMIANLDKLLILGDEEFYNFDFAQAKAQIIKLGAELEKNYLSNRMKELTKLIGEAEKDGGSEKMQALMQELKFISDDFKEISQNFS